MSLIDRVDTKLRLAFQPLSLEVDNFSHEHNVPDGSESHLRVRIVSEKFESVRQVKRHQMVYGALSEELKGGLHALQIQALSPKEEAERLTSPKCKGGEG